eukprot:4741049-Pleurochrysis_carterae.AAC.1
MQRPFGMHETAVSECADSRSHVHARSRTFVLTVTFADTNACADACTSAFGSTHLRAMRAYAHAHVSTHLRTPRVWA